MKHGGDIYTDGLLIGKELLDFSSNVNPMPISKVYRQHVAEALDRIHLYPDAEYRELKTNLIEYIIKSRQYFKGDSIKEGYVPSQEEILVGNGASELLDLVIGSLKSITIVVPSFIEYKINADRHNLNMNFSHLNEEFNYDYDDIMMKIRSTEGIIIGNPNNPNGNIIDHKEFKRILDYCEDNNKIVIIDEAFIEFVLNNNQSFIDDVKGYNCLVIIRAITKFYSMAGVRFGYGITKNKKVLHHIRKNQNPWSVNCFAEVAVEYALFDEEFIEKSIDWILKERLWMYEELGKIPYIKWVSHSFGNYHLCELKDMTSEELCNKLKSQGILIRNCDNYEGLNNRYVRIAIKEREKNMQLIKALNLI